MAQFNNPNAPAILSARQPYYSMPFEKDRIGMQGRMIRNPILAPSPNPRPAAPALQQPTLGATGNRRMSSRIPNQQIDMGTEGMMRIAGNIMGAASQGALPALAAGMQT